MKVEFLTADEIRREFKRGVTPVITHKAGVYRHLNMPGSLRLDGKYQVKRSAHELIVLLETEEKG